MINNRYGFMPVHILLFAVIIFGLFGTGWYVWQTKNKKAAIETTQTTANQAVAIDSFEACKKAGYPIQESYPEVCSANGKSFTNPNQKIAEENSWLLYEPSDKAFSVRIPDGWKAVSLNDNLYVRNPEFIAYKPGTKAQIEVMTEGGWDGPSPFSIYYPKQNYDQIVKEGTKEGVIETKSGLKAEAYVYVEESEPEAIGYQKGDTVYNYYFGADAKYIQIQYVVHEGQTHQFKLIEQAIRTLTIK